MALKPLCVSEKGLTILHLAIKNNVLSIFSMGRCGTYLLVIVLWAGLLSPAAVALQIPDEVGLPFAHEHFAPQDYEQYPQNWAVTQDHRGLIYVANNDGILEYDGASWRLISTLTNTFVRALETDSTGTVWAGMNGDFGYLAPDSVGTMEYRSLHEELPAEDRDFDDVWNIHATSAGTYFQAEEYLFRWDGESMEKWTSAAGFHTSFAVDDELYVREFERGLLRMEDGELQEVPGGSQFEDTPIHLMLAYDEDRILVGTHREGFFMYDGSSFTPFETEADPFLEEHQLYQGTWVRDEYIALATLGAGVLIMNRDGELVRVLDTTAEMPDEVVNYVYADAQDGLWMALNSNGVLRADAVSPLSRYGEQTGLEGVIYDVGRHQGALYAATGSGLYELDGVAHSFTERQAGRRASFRQVDDIPVSWNVTSTQDGLFVATEGGVFRIHDGESTRIAEDRTYIVHASRVDGRLYLGTDEGVKRLQREADDDWSLHAIDGTAGEVRFIKEEDEATLWASTMGGEVKRIALDEEFERAAHVDWFGDEEGLPGEFGSLVQVDEEIYFLTLEGVFSKTTSEGGRIEFQIDTTFVASDEGGELWSMWQDDDDAVWYAQGDRIYRATQSDDGTYERDVVDALQFPMSDVRLRVEDGIGWIGNRRELIRYDPSIPDLPRPNFQTLVREVVAVGEGDERVLYGGTPPPGESTAASLPSTVPYDDNSVRIEFSAPLYGTAAPVEYQYRLEGQRDDWSDWETTASTTFYDLGEGNYTFEVRARDERGAVSAPASLSFEIVPPWYRTHWAYLTYVLLMSLMAVGGWRVYRIVQENKRAREQAKELERERIARERLQEANERLKQANELKDNFLANTSHELRTPLTTILGFTDVLKEEVEGPHVEFVDMIEQSGERLLRTLNALLDLAKLRSGVMKAQLEKVDVTATAEDVVNMFQHEAAQKGLDLHLEKPDEPAYAALDDRYYEQILDNLISNAVKFTDDGHVTVAITRHGEAVQVTVEDTGVGIDEEFLPYLFEDFKQESSGLDRDHGGSGLGLAITARLVELMNGEVDVESEKGVGTTFTVRFPTYATQDDERGDSSPSADDVTRAEPVHP